METEQCLIQLQHLANALTAVVSIKNILVFSAHLSA